MKYWFCFLFYSILSNCVAQEQVSFYFESNKHILNKEELIKLNQWITTNKDVKVIGVYGFCDEIGTVNYNDTLAKKRIDYVYSILKNNVKIRSDFNTKNFGKVHQLSKVKAENRKVTLYYIQPKDFVNEENKDEVINRYKKQLDLYSEVLKKLTGKEVKEKYVYLFGIDEGISI